jgi:fructosamine-3-kinase
MKGNNSLAQIQDHIAAEYHLHILSLEPLGGGDINEVYKVNTRSGEFILKINNAERFPGMFTAEKESLEDLARPGVIRVPKVLGTGKIKSNSYILMEYIESAPPQKDFSKKFGQQLAALHKTTSKDFGYKIDNYIGSLPQYNTSRPTAAEFYINERLEPQFKMAVDRGYDPGKTEFLFKRCEELIPKEPPALVHGDLWSGNYLVDDHGNPCLIDPAVAFAPREMDLGMMKLFGGFDEEIFRNYHKNFPLEKGFEERVPLWQLYYLLVHLNIFGVRYKAQVTSILKRYS